MDLSPDVLSHRIECQACLLGCRYCLVLGVNQVNLQGKVYAPGDATSGVRKASKRRLQSFCEASTRLLHGRKTHKSDAWYAVVVNLPRFTDTVGTNSTNLALTVGWAGRTSDCP
jgi:hypothetical protein